MFAYKTIALPKRMPFEDRMSEVSRQISEWVDSFREVSNTASYKLRLTKVEKTDDEYKYHYSITLGTCGTSAANAKERS
jgi:hypothetical protein